MKKVDFGKIPNIEKQLNKKEIEKFNEIFNKPDILDIMEQAEEARLIRDRYNIILSIVIITLIILALIFQLFFLILPLWILLLGLFFWIQSIFSPKIEYSLKQKIMTKVCKVLHKDLLYSYDWKYSFNEIKFLQKNNFLNERAIPNGVEDSICFSLNINGKQFFINGFELKFSDSQQRVQNSVYMLKAYFPQAKIPMKDNLFIKSNNNNTLKLINEANSLFRGRNILTYILRIIKKYRKISTKEKRVRLEDVEFEKKYNVYCNDPVTSRMIVTPSFMDKIVKFTNESKTKYEFFFTENVLYLKRPIYINFLDISTDKDLTKNLKTYVNFYINMREVIKFLYDMNLFYLSKTDKKINLENIESPKNTPLKISSSKELNLFRLLK